MCTTEGKLPGRLHLYDATQEQTLEELIKIYHDVYDADKASVDRDLPPSASGAIGTELPTAPSQETS
ncbi:hypothetical protein PR002_g22080 [Phytophthora rubi]|uniref:Uncharacterized protein n=1 Tax=Phytophthora rubi TaxID=129364 RepID=A0A6A3IZZ6_9STRA|nr:hypothetical protein PR002_g22080 [Phytophthora rubi]